MSRSTPRRALLATAALAALIGAGAQASSHREAPFITTVPKVDGTDFYMFSSYEAGRADFVTLIANYVPLQDAYGGPNYFSMDPNALYEIHIDNNGDAREDITFQFRFQNALKAIALPIGGKNVPIPLIQAGQVGSPNAGALNVNERFTVNVVRGDRRHAQGQPMTNAANGAAVFDKPVDNIGTKTIPDYAGYAAQHIYSVNMPGCAVPARLFVGQRKDAFALNLGKIFDLVNLSLADIVNPALIGSEPNTIDDKNITTLAVEVHKSCLTNGNDPVIGGWTSASLRQVQQLTPSPQAGLQTTASVGGQWVQVSRLGMPLVNEVVIGLPDKDRFNSSRPVNDGQFADYVTNPTLPRLIEIALSGPNTAPTNFPRTDLVTTFLTGIPNLNKPAGNVVPSEMLRLNTAVPPVPFANQHRLGVLGGDAAGYPNGRRPKDDTIDISLVAVMGGLCIANGNNNALGLGADCKPSAVPLGATVFNLHDKVDQAVVPLLSTFPYLFTPMPGAQ